MVGLAVAVLVVANREPVQGQADDAQSDAPERAEQREGYEERLAARIERYQSALAAQAADGAYVTSDV